MATSAVNMDEPGQAPPITEAPLSFDAVYDAHFAFVWRSVRRLGVIDSAVEDVVQEVFVVVHRRLSSLRDGSPMRSWIFSIVTRVVADTRRSLRRKPGNLGGGLRVAEDVDALVPNLASSPLESAAKAEALRSLHAILDAMPEDRRKVFILAELEQMSVPDIAAAVGENANTVYSRLRAARAQFGRAIARVRASDQWRIR